jgi:hypothetical protein
MTSPLRMPRQCPCETDTCSSALRSASDPNMAALMAPTLVPHRIVIRSPRASSAGSSADSAPTS